MIPDSLSPVANHLWQSTLFAGIAGLLTLIMRKNSPRVRHWIWVTASLKFLVPFSLLITTGSYLQRRTAPVASQTSLSAMFDRVSQPFAVSVDSVPAMNAAPVRTSALPEILWMMWACGFVGFACSWWIRWRRVRAAVHAGTPVQLDPPLRAISSRSFLEPGVFGVFRPVLLVPEGIFERLTPEQWKSVLSHELCHVRNRDNLIGALQMLVETVFWFHPLVWWIGRRIFQEREMSCDEEVLRRGTRPRTYAQTILKVCELYLEAPLECVAGMSGGANLRKRIEGILSDRSAQKMTGYKKLMLAGAGILAMGGPLAVGIIDPPLLHAQPALRVQSAARSQFEAASIKRAANCGATDNIYGGLVSPSPGRLNLNCATAAGLILGAYGRYANGRTSVAMPPPLEGGPSWINSERYVVDAKAEGHENRALMNGPMLQVLLEDRFKLKLHRQTHEGSVFALTVAKHGARLQPFQEGECVPVDYAQIPAPPAPGQTHYCQNNIRSKGPGMRAMHVPGATLAQFSEFLSVVLGRPVIDKTGIKGMFDFQVEFAIDQGTPGFVADTSPANPAEGVSIFSAVQEQLGLKLESTKGPVEVLAIDHIERPSEN